MKRILAKKPSAKGKKFLSTKKTRFWWLFFLPKSAVFKNRFINQNKSRGLKTVFFGVTLQVEFVVCLRHTCQILGSVYAVQVKHGVCLRTAGQPFWGLCTPRR